MRAVDTNVLVRLVTRDDARQTAAAERFIEPGAWISQVVLTETTWVLESAYELAPVQIATAVEMLLNHDHLTVEDADVVAAALDRLRRTPALGFSDCLILEVARKAGHLPLGTFDRKLGKVEGALRVE
jgi:predicted nucleic-acid-binding protein